MKGLPPSMRSVLSFFPTGCVGIISRVDGERKAIGLLWQSYRREGPLECY